MGERKTPAEMYQERSDGTNDRENVRVVLPDSDKKPKEKKEEPNVSFDGTQGVMDDLVPKEEKEAA